MYLYRYHNIISECLTKKERIARAEKSLHEIDIWKSYPYRFTMSECLTKKRANSARAEKFMHVGSW